MLFCRGKFNGIILKERKKMGLVNTAGEIIDLLLNNEKTKIINVLTVNREGKVRIFLIPRWTRLPVNYIEHFQDNDKTIKPGSSEMGGLIVTVDREVYDFSTLETVGEALNYISTSREDLQFVRDYLKGGVKDSTETFNTSFPALAKDVDGLWERGIEVGFVREECLSGVESKSFKEGLIVVQYNATRKSIVSQKRVEKRQKGEEECPYCIQEEGREDHSWNNYILSANPYPYYDRHIVIVNSKHVYQFIDQNELKVTGEFVLNAPEYMVVYNGPPGTSILGHMHFQAGIHQLPIEKAPVETVAQDKKLRVGEIKDFPTRAFVVEKEII